MLINRITNPTLRNFVKGLVEGIILILLAVVVFFVLRNFIFRNASVTGNSMAPTLNHGDVVVLNRLSYNFISPRAGDIVAFPYQGDPSEVYIKRVVGVPGDIIDLQNGQFLINDLPMEDAFAQEHVFATGDVIFPITVGDGHFFVLGDNRNVSKDSRFASVGTVPERDVIGKVLVRFWPIGAFGRVD